MDAMLLDMRVRRVPPPPLPIQLPTLTLTPDLARACRAAWTDFVATSLSWGKSDLEAWRVGVYMPILRRATRGSIPPQADDASIADPRFVERIVQTARAKVVETLWSFGSFDARFDFARRMREEKLVSRCVDSKGRAGFAPSPVRAGLAPRVLSLLAADLLTFPHEFEDIVLCTDCGGLTVTREACCWSGELRRNDRRLASRR